MLRPFRLLLLSVACTAALQAHAQGASDPAGPITVPAGELRSALDMLARQSGTQLVYRSDQIKGLRTRGVQGAPSADAALESLLQGSGFAPRRDPSSGAVVIVKRDTPKRAPAAPAQEDPSGGAAAPPPAPQETLETIGVTGSRIPRTQVEGPAPVTGISDRNIMATPHSPAEGRPGAQKARPPRAPWTTAMTSTP